MVPLLTYTLARIGIFAAALVVLYLLQMRGWLLLLIAVVIAALISYIALPGLRTNAARQVEKIATSSRREKRTEEDREDELVEAAIAESRDEVEADGAPEDGASDEPAEREQ